MIVSDITEPEISAFHSMWEGIAQSTLIPLDDWAGKLPLDQDFGKPRTPKEEIPRYPCDLLWTSSNISVEGNVIYCCHDYSLTSNLPNISEKDYREIWRDEVAAERQRHLAGNFSTMPCANCSAWKTRPKP
jgi:radical SAM protein with 4Fe4S-binding SPASM domain